MASVAWAAMKPDSRPMSLTRADAVGHAPGLGVGAFDGLGGLVDGGLEAEGLGDEVDVVVDGLGDADDGDFEVARLHFAADAQGGLHAAVTADDEQDADIGAFQAVHDLFRGLGTARRAQDGAAEAVDVGHAFGRQFHGLMPARPG